VREGGKQESKRKMSFGGKRETKISTAESGARWEGTLNFTQLTRI